MTEARLRLGRNAEAIAARRLEGDGLRVIERNARVRYSEWGIAGEIDLIALEGRTLVFVEVKGRRAGSATGPERPVLAVTPRKQARLRRLARAWLQARARPLGVAEIRFDAVGLELDGLGRLVAYEHLRGAF